jgi:hypothetical protein
MSDYIKREDVLNKLSVIYDMARPDQRAVVTDAIHEVCHMPVENVREEENILKFFYCESEDDYYLGLRADNFYYAKYDKESGRFVWRMSKYLPWGEHIADENTLWKEHIYPSEPVEIGFEKWLRGFINKYVLTTVGGEL